MERSIVLYDKYIDSNERLSELYLSSQDVCANSIVFIKCTFKNISSKGLAISNIDFTNCLFEDITLDHDASMNKVHFDKCIFSNINIDHNDIFKYVGINHSRINNVKIDNSHIDSCNVKDTYISTMKFVNVTIDNSAITNCTFVDYTKSSLTLRDSRIKCDIVKCNIGTPIISIINCIFKVNSLINNKIGSVINIDTESNLSNAIIQKCPEEGSFIAYKLVKNNKGNLTNSNGLCVAVLQIPEDAKRITTLNNSCRADKAIVLRFEDIDGHIMDKKKKGYSMYDSEFCYNKGELMVPDKFDDDPIHYFSNGINFFMSKYDALHY